MRDHQAGIPMTSRIKWDYKNVWKAAVKVLEETGNQCVMYGDVVLLHDIANKMGWPPEAWETQQRVMMALNKYPGELLKQKIRLSNGRIVSVFKLRNDSNV